MRVLVLCTNSDEAGAPIHVHTVVSSIKDEVVFHVVFGEDGPIAERLRNQGVSVAVVPEMRSAISPLRDMRALRAISQHVVAFDPDLVHAHSSKAGMLGRFVAFRHRIPWVYTVHGWGWRGLGRLAGRLVYWLERSFSKIPNGRYIYVSNSVEREGQKCLRISASRGGVVHNGVADAGAYGEAEGPLRILMAARVTEAKDHESLVRAFEQLSIDSELLLCGGGTDTDAFRALVHVWAPTRHHRIRLMGPRSDVRELLHTSHVVALISNFEALPLAIIEAMSAGRAIVASDVGGVSELVVDGVHGYLVAQRDIKVLTDALHRLLDDNQLRRRLGAAARQRYLDQFTSSAMCEKIIRIYDEAVSTRRDSPC